MIPKSKHDVYFVSARDPLERIISAFVYLHPQNLRARNERGHGIQEGPNKKAYWCFPTLEKFAQDLGRTDKGHCSVQAKRAVDGGMKIMTHLFNNYRKMVAPIPSGAQIYVFRNEHIWEDWITVNKMLDPNRTVVLPTGKKSTARDMSKMKQPVTRDLSDEGRNHLCRAIQQEYGMFFNLLKRSVNLNETDIQETRETANRNCPNLVAPLVPLKPKTRGNTMLVKAYPSEGVKVHSRSNSVQSDGARVNVTDNNSPKIANRPTKLDQSTSLAMKASSTFLPPRTTIPFLPVVM